MKKNLVIGILMLCLIPCLAIGARIKTDKADKYYALFDKKTGALVTSGKLAAGNYLATSLDTLANADAQKFIASLPVAKLPVLPDSGQLEAWEVYRYDGVAVMVKKSHQRKPGVPLGKTLFVKATAAVISR